MEGVKRPSILSDSMEVHKLALSVPGQTMWASDKKKHIQNVSKNGEKTQKLIFNYKILKNTSPKNLTAQFPNLLFKPFLKKIRKEKTQKNNIAIIALYNEKPIAMAITEIRSNKTAEVHSIFTDTEFRRKGLAENLLKLTDKILIQNKIRYSDIVYSDTYKNPEIIEKLIKKTNYLLPEKTTQNIKLNIENVMKAGWIEEFIKDEPDIKIFDFSELSDTDKKEILLSEKQKKYPSYLSPFQMPDYINSRISKIAKFKNKIIGWCVLHNINKETLQCSALFVYEKYREKLISKRMMARAFSDMENIKFTIYQTDYNDKFITDFLNNLFAENKAIENTSHTIASRKYYEKK